MQDRSYSNKAWGKLTGLQPREVSRCERALANALEWRLWVGHVDLLPRGFLDDGSPVVSSEDVFDPEPAPPAASPSLVQAISTHIQNAVSHDLPSHNTTTVRKEPVQPQAQAPVGLAAIAPEWDNIEKWENR